MKSKNSSCCFGIDSETLRNIGLLLFRLVIGAFMLMHGWQKIINYDLMIESFPDPLGVGSALSLWMIIFAEFFCSILLLLGLFTRLAVVPLILGMAVAAFIIHANDPFQSKELAVLYMSMYIVLGILGAGSYSLDNLLTDFYSKINVICCRKS